MQPSQKKLWKIIPLEIEKYTSTHSKIDTIIFGQLSWETRCEKIIVAAEGFIIMQQ